MWEGNSLIRNVLLHALLWVRVVKPRNGKITWKWQSQIFSLLFLKINFTNFRILKRIALVMFSRKFFPIFFESLRIKWFHEIFWFHEFFLISRILFQKTDNLHYRFCSTMLRRPVEEGFSVRHVCSCICKNRFSSFYVICVSQGVRTKL